MSPDEKFEIPDRYKEDDTKLCGYCQGRGYFIDGAGEYEECPQCGGSGDEEYER